MRTEEPRGGIERKILTVVIWIGLLPMILALFIGYVNAREGQRKAVQQTLASTTKDRAEGLEQAAHSIVSRVAALSENTALVDWLTVQAPTNAEFADWLELITAETAHGGDASSIFTLYGPSGEALASTGAPDRTPFDITAWTDKIRAPDLVDFQYDYVGGRYMGVFVAPVPGPRGEILGFFAEEADLERLLTYALSSGAQAGAQRTSADIYRFVFLGPQDVMLSTKLKENRPDKPEACEENIAMVLRESGAQKSNAQLLSVFMSRGVSVNVLFAYHRLGLARPSYMVAFRPAAVAYSNINLGALLSAVASLMVIAVFCLIAYRNIHKNIVLPLSLLNEGAQIIRQGDLDLKLKIDTGDEIEELAVSFNKMAAVLRDNIHQLEESEEKYRGLVTSMRDGIYQADLEGLITFLNPAGLDIFGFSHIDDALGVPLSSLFHDERDFLRIRDELREHGFVERSRVWMRRRDGKTICIEISSNRVYDEDARVLGMEGIFRDITKSVRLEQDVRERAERISAINQIANVINANLEVDRLFDSLVIEVKKLVDFDYSAVALLTERGDVFKGRQLWPEHELSPGRSFTLHREESCAGCVLQQRGSLIVDDLAADGGANYLDEFPPEMQSFIAVPLYAQDSIIGTLNLASRQKAAFSKHDIEVLEQVAPHVAVAIHNAQLLESLQQSLEEVTQAREKLHEANEELKTLDEMKTNLLSNVSHELRTPLVAVMGYTDMIINEKVGPVNSVQQEYLGISLRNIEKLVTLIENLLDFSRLHRGAEKLVFSSFDLVDAAETSLQIVRPVADGRDIKLILNSPSEKVMVEGDKGKIGQVFNNLLSNAVKFNHSGGSVTIDICPGDDGVEVLVTDTGIGIPPEALDKVFTRFYQYDSSSTRKYGGTGIGLAIAQDIARLHGSRIAVSSEVGKGTVFRFVLPLHGKTRRDRDGEPKEEQPGETHLLIELVTQDRALSTQVRNLLVSEGMDVIHASNPEYALSLAGKHRPDCLLVDLEANGGGATLMDSLLHDNATKTIPIALLTNDDAIYGRYRDVVASRIKRSFRKSTLMSGIRSALRADGEARSNLGGKILCVDDDTEILMFMQRCLENEGYVTEGCGSGEKAVEKVASHEFRLVLLDIAMPGIDGWEACKLMRADSELDGMRVYIVTAKPVDMTPQRLREVGADGYLMKPFRPEDLVSLVQSLGIFQPTTE